MRQLNIDIVELCALFIGQFTESLKAKFRSLTTYKDLEKSRKPVKLIHSIKCMAFNFESHKNHHIATFVLKSQIVNTH